MLDGRDGLSPAEAAEAAEEEIEAARELVAKQRAVKQAAADAAKKASDEAAAAAAAAAEAEARLKVAEKKANAAKRLERQQRTARSKADKLNAGRHNAVRKAPKFPTTAAGTQREQSTAGATTAVGRTPLAASSSSKQRVNQASRSRSGQTPREKKGGERTFLTLTPRSRGEAAASSSLGSPDSAAMHNIVYPGVGIYAGATKPASRPLAPPLRHGYGKCWLVAGEVYEGQWRSNQMHGHGKIVYPTGSVYEGDFAHNTRHGQGILTYPNHDSYEGGWVEDSKEGHGCFSWPSAGSAYVGQFSAGVMHGHGRYDFSDGCFFEGEYEDGRRHGRGTFTDADGKAFTAEWNHGVQVPGSNGGDVMADLLQEVKREKARVKGGKLSNGPAHAAIQGAPMPKSAKSSSTSVPPAAKSQSSSTSVPPAAKSQSRSTSVPPVAKSQSSDALASDAAYSEFRDEGSSTFFSMDAVRNQGNSTTVSGTLASARVASMPEDMEAVRRVAERDITAVDLSEVVPDGPSLESLRAAMQEAMQAPPPRYRETTRYALS